MPIAAWLWALRAGIGWLAVAAPGVALSNCAGVVVAVTGVGDAVLIVVVGIRIVARGKLAGLCAVGY